MAIDAFLFDLGGVVIDIDFEQCARAWACAADIDVQHIHAHFEADDTLAALERGEIDHQHYFRHLRGQLHIDLSDREFVQGWEQILVGTVPGIDTCLERLARHYPLYALTNTNRLHESVWRRRYAATLAPFTHIFSSARLGMLKPDAAIYRHACREMGLPAANILFIDDLPANIEGAQACGMQTLQVDDNRRLVALLDRLFDRRQSAMAAGELPASI
jgi:putative hydrolase of the HAD superfamily